VSKDPIPTEADAKAARAKQLEADRSGALSSFDREPERPYSVTEGGTIIVRN